MNGFSLCDFTVSSRLVVSHVSGGDFVCVQARVKSVWVSRFSAEVEFIVVQHQSVYYGTFSETARLRPLMCVQRRLLYDSL